MIIRRTKHERYIKKTTEHLTLKKYNFCTIAMYNGYIRLFVSVQIFMRNI